MSAMDSDMKIFEVTHVVELGERTIDLLSRLLDARHHNHHHKVHLEGEVKIMFVVKDDQPDVAYTITPATSVLDGEGNPITPTPHINYTIASSDSNVVSLIPGTDDLSGTAHFGAPGTASITVTATLDDGTIMAADAANFVVTTGNPTSVQGIGVQFAGLTEQTP